MFRKYEQIIFICNINPFANYLSLLHCDQKENTFLLSNFNKSPITLNDI